MPSLFKPQIWTQIPKPGNTFWNAILAFEQLVSCLPSLSLTPFINILIPILFSLSHSPAKVNLAYLKLPFLLKIKKGRNFPRTNTVKTNGINHSSHSLSWQSFSRENKRTANTINNFPIYILVKAKASFNLILPISYSGRIQISLLFIC